MKNVAELMTPIVHTLSPHASLKEAARLFWEHDCGLAPVVGDDQRPLGVITDRDVCMAAYLQGRPLDDVQVTAIMATDVSCARPTDDALEALKMMARSQVRRLPVIDAEGCLLGIISLNDLVRCSARGDLDSDEVVAALAEISEPREAARA